ncbi:MAG: M24 family metallopeptidase [bacterium]
MNRIEKLYAKVRRRKFDAILVDSPFEVLFLLNIEASFNFVEINPALVVASKPYLVCDMVTLAKIKPFLHDDIDLVEADTLGYLKNDYRYVKEIRTILRKEKTKRLAVITDRYAGALGNIATVRVANLVAKMGMVKSKYEIGLLREAVRISDEAFASKMKVVKEGVSELKLRSEVDVALHEKGAEKRSFPTIVAFGENTAEPHPVPGPRKLKKGDLIMVDMGAVFKGYGSDLTRTGVYGNPKAKQKELFNVVLAAQLRAIEFMKPGRLASEVDSVAREYITGKGYGDFFPHLLGHPCGLMRGGIFLHPTSKEVIKENMTFTMEPGIYLPGYGGVRLEDIVVVKDDGCEVLTQAPKELAWERE